MKNIGRSTNCNMEIYLYLLAPSKTAQKFYFKYTFNIYNIQPTYFCHTNTQDVKDMEYPPQPKKPTQTLSTNNPFNTSK